MDTSHQTLLVFAHYGEAQAFIKHFQLEKTNTQCKELFDFIREQDYYIFYLEYEYPSDHLCVHNNNLTDFRIKFKNHILIIKIDFCIIKHRMNR